MSELHFRWLFQSSTILRNVRDCEPSVTPNKWGKPKEVRRSRVNTVVVDAATKLDENRLTDGRELLVAARKWFRSQGALQ